MRTLRGQKNRAGNPVLFYMLNSFKNYSASTVLCLQSALISIKELIIKVEA